MIKTKICKFYKNGTCRYMKNPKLCPYAHGLEDCKFLLCRFDGSCSNKDCNFKHLKSNDIETILENNYINKILDHVDFNYLNIIKILKNKISIYKKECSNYNNYILKLKKEYNILKEKNNKLIIELNKEKDYSNTSTNTDPILTDNALIQTKPAIEKENDVKTNIIKNNRKILDNGITGFTPTEYNKHKQNTECKNGRNDENVENTIKEFDLDLDKKLTKYKKWINIYRLFKLSNFNYKNIDLDELKQYIQDNNIYKVKERALKVYTYYTKLMNKEVTDYLYVTEIFKMKI